MIEDELVKIKKDIEELKNQRVTQDKIVNDQVKARHIGEGVRYVRAGLAADIPTDGVIEGAIYVSTDTYVLSIWLNGAWKTETLS